MKKEVKKMSIGAWYNSKLKKLRWHDISLVKLASAAFALMIAKLWSPLLSLEWYWYGIIALVASGMVLWKVFKK